jgi:hypothetical protein
MNAHRRTAVCVTALVVGLQTLAYSQTASENAIRMNRFRSSARTTATTRGSLPANPGFFRRKISNSIRRLNIGTVLWISN